MNNIVPERAGPMRNPPHLGELIRERMDAEAGNITETVAYPG